MKFFCRSGFTSCLHQTTGDLRAILTCIIQSLELSILFKFFIFSLCRYGGHSPSMHSAVNTSFLLLYEQKRVFCWEWGCTCSDNSRPSFFEQYELILELWNTYTVCYNYPYICLMEEWLWDFSLTICHSFYS